MSINHLQTTSQSELGAKPDSYKPVTYNRTQRRQKPANTYHRRSVNPEKPNVNPSYVCIRCDRQGHHLQNHCPFINAECYACRKTGHIQRACKTVKQQ